MFLSIAKRTGIAAACMMALMVISFWGCPSPKTTPDGAHNPDGGSTPEMLAEKASPLTCEAGTLCITVGHPKARSCDLLLANKATVEAPQAAFGSGAIGEMLHRDSRIALVFIAKSDQAFGTDNAALLKLKDGVAEVTLKKATCYDRNGNALKDPAVALNKP